MLGRPKKYTSEKERLEARRQRLKKYQKTEKYRQALKKYRSSEKYRRVQKEYTKSEKYKDYIKAYLKTDKFKEQQKKYRKSEKFKNYQKDYQKKYRETEKFKNYQKKYRETEKYKENINRYALSDKGKKAAQRAKIKYSKTDKGKAALLKASLKRRETGKAAKYDRIWRSNKRKNNPIFKLSETMRNRIKIYLKTKSFSKSNKTFEMIGCSPLKLKEHLENQFKPGMNWQNHSLKGWHVDHIIPLASAKNEEDVKRLMHYTNLQPLWARENIIKKDK